LQLQHPIIKALNGTQYEWLSNLLFAFNAGDLAKFNAILKQEGKQVPASCHPARLLHVSQRLRPACAQEVLSNKSNVTFLNLKIRIMAFMDMVRPLDAVFGTVTHWYQTASVLSFRVCVPGVPERRQRAHNKLQGGGVLLRREGGRGGCCVIMLFGC
jgi:hypothetical protein